MNLFVSAILKKFFKKERNFFIDAYAKINLDSPSLRLFHSEISSNIELNIPLTRDISFLDFGCGKGYFLNYLNQRGYKNLQGVEPCKPLRDNKLFINITDGSYEENSFEDNSFDIVFTCHTMHHLSNKYPLYAIKEMLRISKKYIVLVEINNLNLPMIFRSLLYISEEKNAFRYNLKKVQSMLACTKCNIVYSDHMRSCYLSGNSLGYRIMAKMGKPPYNISIATKDTRK